MGHKVVVFYEPFDVDIISGIYLFISYVYLYRPLSALFVALGRWECDEEILG